MNYSPRASARESNRRSQSRPAISAPRSLLHRQQTGECPGISSSDRPPGTGAGRAAARSRPSLPPLAIAALVAVTVPQMFPDAASSESQETIWQAITNGITDDAD